MSMAPTPIEKQVEEFCSQIGADPLLVQGAGGNVSWKDGDVLWVKASGTWLAEAESKKIFVSVNLPLLQEALIKHDFSVNPEVTRNSDLRPSIETLLHALMPQQFVIHLHPVEILSILVRKNYELKIQSLLGTTSSFGCVDYCKPGPSLAQAVSFALRKDPSLRIIFLQSHGIVIGADSIDEAVNFIDSLTKLCANDYPDTTIKNLTNAEKIERIDGYEYIKDTSVQSLALHRNFFEILESAWALYPDHVVFLGRAPFLYLSRKDFISKKTLYKSVPELIFISGEGVYVHPDFSQAKRAQLRCYADIIMRQTSLSELRSLSDEEIEELINWDAEKYRLQTEI